MAWWNRKPAETITAAAHVVTAAEATIAPQNVEWQTEAWNFLDTVGQYRTAVMWKAEMLSRVRLVAARVRDSDDEPEPIVFDPDDQETLTSAERAAVDLVAKLTKGAGGSAAMLKTIETHLTVPGESFLVGETIQARTTWLVYSADEIRRSQKPSPGRAGAYEVMDGEASGAGTPVWRELAQDSLVIRIWRPHPRYHYQADSAARSMRATLRELELLNRKIAAKLQSRLAVNGLLLMPDEVAFPPRPDQDTDEDQFIPEFIRVAKEAIKTPGSASAVIPIPMKVPAEYIEKVRHIDFWTKSDDKDVEDRNAAIQQLAIQVDVPPEILTGMDGLNHWGAWAIEEQAVKTHVASDAELIVDAFTTGYLIPMLRAMGEDPTDLVIWYDTSELTAKPDLSDNAEKAYANNTISRDAYNRAKGFDPSDVPDDVELERQILIELASQPATGPWALSLLTGKDEYFEGSPVGRNSPEQPVEEVEDPPVGDEKTPPATEDAPPDAPALAAAAAVLGRERQKRKQANLRHLMEVDLDKWVLHHPEECANDHLTLTECPVAQSTRILKSTPGNTGIYELRLSKSGDPSVGHQTFEPLDGFVRGHSRRRNGARQRA